MTTPGPDHGLETLRECQDRSFAREGVPMVLALVSEVGAVPPAAEADVLADGVRLAGAMDRFRAELVPTARETDMGCLISVLQAVSYDDFGRAVR